MATREQKLAAVEAAQAKHGITNKAQAELFVDCWDACAKLEPIGTARNSALVLLEVVPTTDAQEQQAAEIQEQSLALVRGAVCPVPGS